MSGRITQIKTIMMSTNITLLGIDVFFLVGA